LALRNAKDCAPGAMLFVNTACWLPFGLVAATIRPKACEFSIRVSQ